MTLMLHLPPATRVYRRRLATIAVFLLCGTSLLLAGCGGSSKPAYCSDVTNFKNAVEQLKQVSSPSALVTQVKKVASTGQTTLSAVKTNLAPQTSAVKNSLAALENSVKQLSSSSTRASALAAIPAESKAVVSAGESLASAAKPKCS
jgi:hypothetical protein